MSKLNYLQMNFNVGCMFFVMKFFLAICAFCVTPLIQGLPNEYSQRLESRSIGDLPVFSWFFGSSSENDTDKTDTQNTDETQIAENFENKNLSQTNHPKVQYISNEDKSKLDREVRLSRGQTVNVQPVEYILPGEKPELAEKFLKEMETEIKESNDENRKNYTNVLQELEKTMEKSPKPLARVFIDKAWHLLDIGLLNSSRRIRNTEDTSALVNLSQMLLGLISQIFQYIPFLHSMVNQSPGVSTFNSMFPTGVTNYFGNPAHQTLLGGALGVPKINGNNVFGMGGNQPINDIFTIICWGDDKKSDGENNDSFVGKSNDEVLSTIRKMVDEGKTNTKEKWIIVVKLFKMFNDPNIDKQTKDKIVEIVVIISDNPEFEKIFETLKQKEQLKPNSRYKDIWNLFKNNEEKLKELHVKFSDRSKTKKDEEDPDNEKEDGQSSYNRNRTGTLPEKDDDDEPSNKKRKKLRPAQKKEDREDPEKQVSKQNLDKKDSSSNNSSALATESQSHLEKDDPTKHMHNPANQVGVVSSPPTQPTNQQQHHDPVIPKTSTTTDPKSRVPLKPSSSGQGTHAIHRPSPQKDPITLEPPQNSSPRVMDPHQTFGDPFEGHTMPATPPNIALDSKSTNPKRNETPEVPPKDPEHLDGELEQHDVDPEHHNADLRQHDVDPSLHDIDPSHHVIEPKHHDADPSHYNVDPGHHDDDPSRHDVNPQHHDGDPQHHDGDPKHHDIDPKHHDTDPKHHDTDPKHHDIDPKHHDIDPKHHDIDPKHHNGDPSHYDVDPSHYGIDPSHYGVDPSHYSVDPSHYGVDPSRHDDDPSRHDDDPSRHDDDPRRHDDDPSRHDDDPSRHDDDPSRHDDDPSRHDVDPEHHDIDPKHHDIDPKHHDVDPSHHNGDPSHYDVDPSRHDDDPSRHDDDPSRHDVDPQHHDVDPKHHDADPRHHNGGLSHYDGDPSHYNVDPGHHDDDPSRHDVDPSRHNGNPSYYDVDPEHHDIDPKPYDVDPSHYDVDPRHHDVDPEHHDVDPEHRDVDPEHHDVDPEHHDGDPEHRNVDPNHLDDDPHHQHTTLEPEDPSQHSTHDPPPLNDEIEHAGMIYYPYANLEEMQKIIMDPKEGFITESREPLRHVLSAIQQIINENPEDHVLLYVISDLNELQNAAYQNEETRKLFDSIIHEAASNPRVLDLYQTVKDTPELSEQFHDWFNIFTPGHEQEHNAPEHEITASIPNEKQFEVTKIPTHPNPSNQLATAQNGTLLRQPTHQSQGVPPTSEEKPTKNKEEAQAESNKTSKPKPRLSLREKVFLVKKFFSMTNRKEEFGNLLDIEEKELANLTEKMNDYNSELQILENELFMKIPANATVKATELLATLYNYLSMTTLTGKPEPRTEQEEKEAIRDFLETAFYKNMVKPLPVSEHSK